MGPPLGRCQRERGSRIFLPVFFLSFQGSFSLSLIHAFFSVLELSLRSLFVCMNIWLGMVGNVSGPFLGAGEGGEGRALSIYLFFISYLSSSTVLPLPAYGIYISAIQSDLNMLMGLRGGVGKESEIFWGEFSSSFTARILKCNISAPLGSRFGNFFHK